MKLLTRLVTGQIALWRTFWLIGVPLALVWDLSGACMVLGVGVEDLFLAGFVIALFTLASAALPLVAVAIWRSASNYPRDRWWRTPLAIGAKACAAWSGLTGALSLLGVFYLAFIYIYAAIGPA
jgi:hypothetical protein